MKLQCPYCKESLKLRAKGSCECMACGFSSIDHCGISMLTKNRDFYYGEIDKMSMVAMIEQCKHIGWKKAFSGMLEGRADQNYIKHYALSEERAAWKFLLPISRNKSVCDIGCGWGNTSISLARNCQKVVAVDLTKERLAFLRERAQQDDLKNIVTVCGGDTPYFPFENNSFDIVILNGILEWAAISRKGNPKKIQRMFLEEINRILTVNGQVYIGIENRLNYKYFLGSRDDHTSLKYGAILPRFIANLQSLIVRGKQYREYTYSYMGYNKMLSNAGFNDRKIYIPIGDYREFRYIVDPDNNQSIKSYFTRYQIDGKLSIKKTIKKKFFKLLAPSFLIMGSKNESHKCFLSSLFAHLKSTNPVFAKMDLDMNNVQTYRVSKGTETVSVNIVTKKIDKPNYILKLPLSIPADINCQKNVMNLNKIRILLKDNILANYKIPSIEFVGICDGQKYYIESLIGGINLVDLISDESLCKQLVLSQSVEFIVNLCKKTKRTVIIDNAKYNNLIGKDIEFITKTLGGNCCQFLFSINNYLKKSLLNSEREMCAVHGDYWHGNIIYDTKKNVISGVIDWDLFEEEQFPLLDIIHFLSYFKTTIEDDRFRFTINKYLFNENILKEHESIFKKYSGILGHDIDVEYLHLVGVVYWIKQVRKMLRFHSSWIEPRWIDSIFQNTLEYMHKKLCLGDIKCQK